MQTVRVVIADSLIDSYFTIFEYFFLLLLFLFEEF